MTINRTLIERIDEKIGKFYKLHVWRKDTQSDLHVHMIFKDPHITTRAKDTVERYGGTNIHMIQGETLGDLWFDIDVKEQISDNNPLDLILRTYIRTRPEPNEWDP